LVGGWCYKDFRRTTTPIVTKARPGISADPTFQPPQNQRHRQHHLDIAIPPTQKPEQRTQ
ncbi:unnamed protein product, partial [Prunus brigantina]